MTSWTLVLLVLALSSVFYFLAKRRSLRVATTVGGIDKLHSAPRYYGVVAALLFAVPAMLVLGVWLSIDQNIILKIVLTEYFPELNWESKVDVNWLTSQIQILAQTGRLEKVENAAGIECSSRSISIFDRL